MQMHWISEVEEMHYQHLDDADNEHLQQKLLQWVWNGYQVNKNSMLNDVACTLSILKTKMDLVPNNLLDMQNLQKILHELLRSESDRKYITLIIIKISLENNNKQKAKAFAKSIITIKR